jgi:hypothetical protein
LEAFDAGAGWNMVNGMLVSDGSTDAMVYAPFDPNGLANYAVEAEIQVLPSEHRRGFGVFGRATDAGEIWLSTGSLLPTGGGYYGDDGIRIFVGNDGEKAIAGQEYAIDGEWHTYRLEVDGNQIRGLLDGAIILVAQDNRFLDPGLTGLFVQEHTQINVRAFRVIALGDGSASSQPAVTSASGNQTTPGSVALTSANLDTLVPTMADVPMNLIHLDTHHRTLPEVVQNYADPATTIDLFTSWGWTDNIACSFGMPDGVYPEAEQINGIYVSIHALGSPESARAALYFSLDQQAIGTPLGEVASPGLGEYSRALYGTLDYGNEITLLVQSKNLLIRVSAAQIEGDPTGVATGIAQGILARAG